MGTREDREKMCSCNCICFRRVAEHGDICGECRRGVHPFRDGRTGRYSLSGHLLPQYTPNRAGIIAT